MRDRATLDFIRDRVLADIAANPSVRPYLGEEAPREVCRQGHPITGEGRARYCRTCHAERRRVRLGGQR